MEKFSEVVKNSKITPKVLSMIPQKFKNLIIYGPPHCNKYIYALSLLSQVSPSNLSYEKKITVVYNNNETIYRMSDVHIEINFEFLGCIAKNLWATIFQDIKQIVGNKEFYIVCNNFSSVNNELMENFYTYINNDSPNIKFILLTDNISCIPEEVVNASLCYPIKRGSIITQKDVKIKTQFVEKIVEFILDSETFNIKSLRNILYELLIYQEDVYIFMFELLKEVNNHVLIEPQKMIKLLNETKKILKLFNNNYRSIYHLENFIITIISAIS
jgi:hypothetical protein